MSTTALHWLTEEGLEQIYGDIRRHVLKRGGVFLNGDHLCFSLGSTVSAKLSEMEAARALQVGSSGGGQTWEDWWGAAARSPDLSAEYALRAERFPAFEEEAITAEFHVGALIRVGFKEAEIVWRNLNNCLVLGIA